MNTGIKSRIINPINGCCTKSQQLKKIFTGQSANVNIQNTNGETLMYAVKEDYKVVFLTPVMGCLPNPKEVNC